MNCPKCGSEDLSKVVYTHTINDTEKGGFNLFDAVCGALLFGWAGLLCGFCDSDKRETKTRTYERIGYECNNCGAKFNKSNYERY